VSPDGHLRYTPAVTLSGLPRPASLGRYAAFVAWVTSPTMDVIQRLGAVDNGRNVLPAISLDKFIVLVTAEESARATDMRGRLLLRGMSPSTRLQPPDFMQFLIGATREDSAHHEHHEHYGMDSLGWSMVPMPAGISMLPAEMTLRPNAAPYLPRPANPDSLPLARPRTLVRLTSGDTLRLTAGIVRRPFKGQTLTMFAFNGQYPGPLLQVAQGAQITVELTNALDQPTTVHWHGVRLDNANDGVPDMTQRAVAPGERFTYHLRFPDAGIYWYHPHVREDVQQDLGLYGNIMVRSPRPDYFSPADREQVLMLDDLLLGEDGMVPFGASTATHALMGRFGNVMLVNGEPRYALSVDRGEVVRFFFTNVSNTRAFNLSFPGARMKVVAGDVGNYEREQWVESVVIGPAERYVVHVRFDRPGDIALVNRVRGLDHLYGRFFSDAELTQARTRFRRVVWISFALLVLYILSAQFWRNVAPPITPESVPTLNCDDPALKTAEQRAACVAMNTTMQGAASFGETLDKYVLPLVLLVFGFFLLVVNVRLLRGKKWARVAFAVFGGLVALSVFDVLFSNPLRGVPYIAHVVLYAGTLIAYAWAIRMMFTEPVRRWFLRA